MKNKGFIYTDYVLPADEGVSVAAFYSLHYTHSTEKIWRRRIQSGQILLNDRQPSPDEPLTRGDCLAYHRPPWEEPGVPTSFTTLLEDNNLLILAKPAGLPVLPGGGFLENTLLHLVRQRYGDGCSPLHRLGRGTSGAILFTRNSRTARILGNALSERRIQKVYLALALGTAMPDTFTVDAPIGPVPYHPLTTIHAYCPHGRPSISHVRVICRRPLTNATLLEVTIPTGRPHQIRIHLSYAGFSLVGDSLYQTGGLPSAGHAHDECPALPGDGGYFLHSWKIRFPYPERGEDMEVICPPPPILDPTKP